MSQHLSHGAPTSFFFHFVLVITGGEFRGLSPSIMGFTALAQMFLSRELLLTLLSHFTTEIL
jgi:hypothetical protein